MTELSTVISQPERDIETVTREILDLQQQTRRLVLAYAIEVGRRLEEAKELLPHGEWGAWLRERVQFSERTAQRMMQLYDAYGADQIGIFGAELKPSALTDLSYTKALMLISVPENDREDFAAEVDAEHLSTRELANAIKERDAARKELEQERSASEGTAMRMSELQDEVQASTREADKLKRELEVLRSRPVTVAVQEPDEGAVRAEAEKLLADAEAKHRAEIEKLEKSLAAAEKKRDKAEAEAKAAEQKAQAAALDALGEKKAAEQAAEPFKAEAERLRRELQMADPVTAQFKVHFAAAQADVAAMLELLPQAPAESGEKLRAALRAVVENWRGAICTDQ